MTESNSTDSLAKQVIDRIDREHITPRSSWEFFAFNMLIWLLGLIAMALGALAIAAVLFVVLNRSWTLEFSAGHSFIFILVRVLPLLWLIVFFIFVSVCLQTVRFTKRGYRYPLSLIVGGTVVISATLGGLLFLGGFGETVEESVGDHPPYYRPTLLEEQSLWNNPARGRLGGEIATVTPQTLFIKDFSGVTWAVPVSDALSGNVSPFHAGEFVRVVGIAATTSPFHACLILPWRIHGSMHSFTTTSSSSEIKESQMRSELCKGITPYSHF